MMQRLVTPGWPSSLVGNEPSGCCSRERNVNPRSTARSSRSHCWGDSSSRAAICPLWSAPAGLSGGSARAIAKRLATIAATNKNATHLRRLVSTLVDRKNLIGHLEREDGQGSRVDASELPVFFDRFGIPRPVLMLSGSEDSQERGKEPVPIVAAELEHCLAAIELAVVVAVFLVSRIVVGLERVPQDPLAGGSRSFRAVFAS